LCFVPNYMNMNKVSAIVLLVLILIYIVKPITPFFEYYLRKDYIAKNLCVNRDKPNSCCHGKCYLKKQLANESEPTEADHKDNSRKTNHNEISVFIIKKTDLPILIDESVSNRATFNNFYCYSFLPEIFVPPEESGLISI
jgi:hypothetical protein